MESFIPAKSFQVLYDFEGTNDRELTVTSGEILLAQGINLIYHSHTLHSRLVVVHPYILNR